MSQATAAKETKFYRSDSIISPVYEEIKEVKSITGMNTSFSMIDVTSFGPGFGRDRVPSLEEGIDVTLEANLLRATYMKFVDDYLNKELSAYKVELPDDPTGLDLGEYTFEAYVSKHEPLLEYEGVVGVSIVLSVNEKSISFTQAP